MSMWRQNRDNWGNFLDRCFQYPSAHAKVIAVRPNVNIKYLYYTNTQNISSIQIYKLTKHLILKTLSVQHLNERANVIVNSPKNELLAILTIFI